jgi:ferritin
LERIGTVLSKKMEKAFNDQINAEIYSAYLYLSMQAYCEAEGLSGMANWMHCQVQEEMVHARMMFDFVNERMGRVTLKAIEGPPTKWDSPLAVFEHVFEHEQKVTGLIDDLVGVAEKESDRASLAFLQWFISEQVEEEASADAIVQKLKLMGKDGRGIYMVDRELAQRVFTPPARSED